MDSAPEIFVEKLRNRAAIYEAQVEAHERPGAVIAEMIGTGRGGRRISLGIWLCYADGSYVEDAPQMWKVPKAWRDDEELRA